MSPPLSTAVPGIPADAAKPAKKTGPKRVVIGLIAAGLATAAYFGVGRWQFAKTHEETDDAQIEGHVSPVLPRVPGYVSRVLLEDNQHVDAGQVLIEIDARELDLKVEAAMAALSSAQADLVTTEASLADAKANAKAALANVATAAVRQRKAASDLARDSKLFETGAITESQLTDTRAAAETADAQLEALRSEAAAAQMQVPVATARIADARTQVAARNSDLDFSKLQRSYASVSAPIAGLISRKNVEPGQFVQAGQTLLSIADDTENWIVANFKETQLARIRAGQPVEFTVDGYRGALFHGVVNSIAGATGARFALLPPDNSSGNFVKVTQRVPVKISLAGPPDRDHPLRPGMSVDVAIRVTD